MLLFPFYERRNLEQNVYTLFVRHLETAAWTEIERVISVFAKVGENYDVH